MADHPGDSPEEGMQAPPTAHTGTPAPRCPCGASWGAPNRAEEFVEYLALWPRKSEGSEVFFEMCRLREKEGEISSRLCLA